MDCAAYRDCLSLLMFLSEYLLYAFGAAGAKRSGAEDLPLWWKRPMILCNNFAQIARPKGDCECHFRLRRR
jgi:hypothetical protein